MMYWKPPVSRMRDGGFLRLYTLAVFAAILSFVSPSNAGAVTTVSVEKNYYDYLYTAGAFASRLSGQGATISFQDGAFNKAVHVEWGGFDTPIFSLNMFNIGIALEKPVMTNTLLGIGIGFVQCDYVGGPMKSLIGDVYGKVKIIKVGNNSLGSFVAVRMVHPTPFGQTMVIKGGLEISIVK